MATINLSRNTRLWVSTVTSGHNNANTFEVPIQEDYSLSQSTSTSDVTAEEAGPTPTRGAKRFNDSLEPVSWSFSTYINPFMQGTNVLMPDVLMWEGLAVGHSTNAVDFTDVASPVHTDGSKFTVGFEGNSAHVLRRLYMYFLIDNTMYLVEGAQVGQAEISMDISDIAQVAWSGEALEYNPIPTPAFATATGDVYDPASILTDTFVAIPANKEYLVNKLTIMDLNADVAPGTDDNYDIPITGGSITINNNVTYLTPSTLAEVDKPIGSFTGSFMVTGSVDAYLRDRNGTGTTASPYGSAELLAHMLSTGANSVTNAANLVLNIGGKTTGAPGAVITIPTGHLSVPDFSTDDIVSSTMEIMGIPSASDLTSGTEVFLDFYVARA